MSLTAKDVEEVMKLLEASRFDRLSLELDGLKLELARDGSRARIPAAPLLEPAAAAPAPPVRTAAYPEGLVAVKSPMLGIFYRAPKPGEASFVEIGARVEEDTVIGIIEVMKLMTSARAGVRGEVVEIHAPNGELVEHGAVLMLVRPEA